jgi:WS/DGAT/MGAT family acyltransferase
MRRLNGIDADMLYGETPSSHLHVSALLILDPSTAPQGFGIDEWRRLVASEVRNLPPLRERLLEVPFGIDRPLWIDDPHFDLDRHIRHVAVPAPGGDRELAALIGDLSGYKLDRSGPLWEMWFIEGLKDDRVAVFVKVHHACADGMAGAMMLARLFVSEPRPAPDDPLPAPHSEVESLPSQLELFARGLGSLALQPLRVARTLGTTALSLRKALNRPRSRSGSSPALPFQAPRTKLNGPITPHRCFSFSEVPLPDVNAVRKAFDVTVNDVVLAVCAGALRRTLDANGELPDRPLIAAVPVSVRSGEEFSGFGNVVSGLFVSLATDIDDPVERLRAVARGARSAKDLHASGIEDAVMEWASLPRPAAVALAVRLFSSLHITERLPPIFNLLISNVPGPPNPLYAAGARLEACYPMGPLIDQIALNVSVLSYVDSVGFGFLACPEIIPEPWAIAEGIGASLEELVSAAERMV